MSWASTISGFLVFVIFLFSVSPYNNHHDDDDIHFDRWSGRRSVSFVFFFCRFQVDEESQLERFLAYLGPLTAGQFSGG